MLRLPSSSFRFRFRLHLRLIPLLAALAVGVGPISAQAQAPSAPAAPTPRAQAPTGRALTPPIYDMVYGETADGQKLLMDIFQPPVRVGLADKGSQPKLRPAVIFIHGGGWAHGSKKDFRSVAVLMSGLGYVTVPIAYRLTTNPANTWPAQLDDVQLAVRWLRENAATYSIDPTRIGAMGASAGGHLVTCLATRETRDPATAKYASQSSRVNCVVNINGPSDLTEDFAPKVKQGAAVNDLLTKLFGGPRSETGKGELARDASPLFNIDAKTPPFLIVHGDQDEVVPVDQSRRLQEALVKAGVSSNLLILEGEGHSFTKQENQKRFLKDSIVFFNQRLTP